MTDDIYTTLRANKELYDRFRMVVYRRNGIKKGALNAAINDALQSWISKNEV